MSLTIQDCLIVQSGVMIRVVMDGEITSLQYYTSKRNNNAQVGKGVLTISAIKENYDGAQYTSARLVSKGKGDWKYGRIEVRAKLPSGKGLWPAIWMLSSDNAYGDWPQTGEIDIMEHVGYVS
ncbi:MAG: glycoside hydrolase family 16 protein [Agriterribacter sp.]